MRRNKNQKLKIKFKLKITRIKKMNNYIRDLKL